jgi:hypothetical protein
MLWVDGHFYGRIERFEINRVYKIVKKRRNYLIFARYRVSKIISKIK